LSSMLFCRIDSLLPRPVPVVHLWRRPNRGRVRPGVLTQTCNVANQGRLLILDVPRPVVSPHFATSKPQHQPRVHVDLLRRNLAACWTPVLSQSSIDNDEHRQRADASPSFIHGDSYQSNERAGSDASGGRLVFLRSSPGPVGVALLRPPYFFDALLCQFQLPVRSVVPH